MMMERRFSDGGVSFLTMAKSDRTPDMPPPEAKSDRALAAAETLARWMDDRLLDPLMGLFLPGLGDLIGSALGLYPVVLAWRRRAPKALLARMILNLAADAAGGAIPIVGDVWDFVFKAHARNLALLRTRSRAGAVHGHWTDALIVAGAVLALLAAFALPVVLVVLLVRFLLHR